MSNIIFNSGVKFPSLIIPTGSQPLDSRTIVQNLPVYSCEFTEGAVYLGMPVSCLADNNFYTLKSLSTDKFILVIYKGNWELLSEVEKLDEYKALSANDKKVITDTKVENVSKLEWQQVGKETDLTDYYTKSQVDAKVQDAIDAIPDVDLTGYATESYVTARVGEVKTASYAYATSEAVAAASDAKDASYAYAGKVANDAQVASYAYATSQAIGMASDAKDASYAYAGKVADEVKTASYAYATSEAIGAAGNAQTASYAYAGKVAGDAQAASYAYAEAKFNALLGDGKLVETIDTVKEISYWLDNNPNDAVELTLSLAELTEKVTDNEKVVATSINNINSKLTWGVI